MVEMIPKKERIQNGLTKEGIIGIKNQRKRSKIELNNILKEL